MRRRLLLIAFSLLAILGYAATTDVATTAALKWYLQNYARNHFDGELVYDSFTKHEGTWTIDKPRVIQSENSIFRAEKVTIQLGISPLSRSIDIDINLLAPTFSLGDHYQKAIKSAATRSHSHHIIYINQHIVATNGSFVFPTKDNVVPLAFTIDATFGRTSHGSARVFPASDQSDTSQLVATISQEAHSALHLDISVEHMPIAPLAELLRLYYSHMPSITIQTGEASGLLHLELPKKRLIEANGDLVVSNLYGVQDHNEYSVTAPEITLKLISDGSKDHEALVPTAGHVDIDGGASIEIMKKGIPFWHFDDIVGSFSFKNNEGGDFFLNAFSKNGSNETPDKLHLEGYLHFSETNETTLSFKTSLQKENSPDNDLNAHISLRHLAELWDLGEIEVNGFTHEEFNLFKHLISKKFPKLNHVHLSDGVFDASLIVYLSSLQPTEVKFDKIQARNVAFTVDTWELHGGATSVTGSASLDLTVPEPILTLDADLNISNGKASMPGPRGHPWNFVNIDSDFKVRQGIIQQTSLKGSVAGMHANITLDGTDPDHLVKIMLVGSTDDLAPYVSKTLKKNLERHFAHNQVHIEALGSAVSSALDVKGMITFSEKQHEDPPIHFSFALDRKDNIASTEKPPHHVVSEYLTTASMEAIASLLPESSQNTKEKKKKNPLDPTWTLFGYTIQEGRFEANDLCIDKYLSPFIFAEDQMKACGIGAFYGIFDLHGIKVDYDASDLVLKNSDFSIEMKKICQQNEICTQLVASHYFDFDEGKGYGILPVSGGSYFEKNSGLLFTDIDALIFLQHDRAHITELSTFCNGIHFMGNIEVDWSMPGNGIFEIDVHVAEMDGKVSQFQHLFSHFNQPLFFLKIPLEGNISLRNKGAHLFFAFEPGDFHMDSTIEGSITDGSLNSSGLDMTIHDVSMNFGYNHAQGTLDFADVQATLLVGPPNHFEEYVIASDGIRFTDFKKNESHFDVWVADKTRDVVRVVGKTYEDRGANDEPVIKVDIDKELSHFGNVYPKNVELILDITIAPILFNLEFDFTLDALLTDLQRFSRSGLLFLSRSMLKELNGIKQTEGKLSGSINYLKSLSLLEYKVHGNAIKIDDHKVDTFELVGTKRGDLWSIEQLQIDNIALSLDIHKDPDLWNINFLGARLGSSVLIGMEGVYIPEEDRLKAKVNLCEIDLAALKEWPFLAPYVEQMNAKGLLRTNGTFNIAFDKSLPEFGQIELHATGTLTNGQYETYSFDDIQELAIDYTTRDGFSVRNVQTILSSVENGEARAGLYLNGAHYNPNAKALHIQGLYFNVPTNQLGWLSRHLEDRYSSVFSSTALDLISNLKSSGTVQGNISAVLTDTQKNLRVALNDDIYHWANKEYHLINAVVDYTPFSVKFNSKFLHENAFLNIAISAEAPDYNRGIIAVSEDLPAGSIPTLSPLTIYWNSVGPGGFSINKVNGHLCGISIDLANDTDFPLNPHYHHLVGTVSFDLSKATKLMTTEKAAAINAAQIGQGYSLHGRFAIDKSGDKSFGDRLYFQGDLSGSGFTCYGYRLNYLTGQLDYQPTQALISNLSISDACGQISIPTISFMADANTNWQANIPRITIKDLHPSSMESVTPSPTSMQKSLMIRLLEIENLQGTLGDRTSFRGTGKLNFINTQKENFQDTIFAIPAELLTRIGLDLGVLTPVRGNVEFDISDAKVHLRKFKEVYSKKKISKFQLTKTGYQSYIDFDGNIHVQIKMKQYNLVFKLAELFTVTVGGTISKPTYSLQKQPRDNTNE